MGFPQARLKALECGKAAGMDAGSSEEKDGPSWYGAGAASCGDKGGGNSDDDDDDDDEDGGGGGGGAARNDAAESFDVAGLRGCALPGVRGDL